MIGIIVSIGVAVEVWGRLSYHRWRKCFDALPPDEQRKCQEDMCKTQQAG